MTKRMSFASAPGGGGQRVEHDYSNDLSFAEVAERAKPNMLRLAQHLLPGGQVNGHEYICAGLQGGRGRSLSVTVGGPEAGRFKDFADTSVAGADGINLWAAVRGLSQREAKAELETWLGISRGERVGAARAPNPKPAGSTPATLANPAQDDDPTWYRSAKPQMKWEYRDARGNVWGVVYRFVHPATGAKVVRPWDPARMVWEAPEGKRPLFGLDRIIGSDGPIVVVEGEKCADAITEIGQIGTTVMGGALAIAKTDWSPLTGRHVVLWRDNDHAGVDWLDKATEALRAVNVGSIRVVEIPAGKPEKWDCADAPAEERRALLAKVMDARPVVTGRPLLRLTDWTADQYTDAAPERRWLVREVFPLAIPAVLAAMGDTGKGMMVLDLALKVASAEPGAAPHLVTPPMAFGCTVSAFGRVVILSAEDDRGELHRRMDRLDPGALKRHKAKDRLIVVPLPNAGGPIPLIRGTGRGPEVTDEFNRLRDQLLAMDDLALVVIDPLSQFILADLNKDGAVASMVMGVFAQLASEDETGATVLAVHHMRKAGGRDAIVTPEQARDAIRGQSGIVDNSRMAYALWPSQPQDAKGVLKTLGEPTDGDSWRNRVVYGAVVKANGPADRTVRTYVRDPKTGLLIDRTSPIVNVKRDRNEEMKRLMIRSIQIGAERGFPFTRMTKDAGVFEKTERLHPELRRLGRDRLRKMTDELIADGLIVTCRDGGKTAPWLDVVGGPFAQGTGAFDSGACKPWEWWDEPEPKEK